MTGNATETWYNGMEAVDMRDNMDAIQGQRRRCRRMIMAEEIWDNRYISNGYTGI